MAEDKNKSGGKPVLSDEIVEKIIKCSKTIPDRIFDVTDFSMFKIDNMQKRRNIDLICNEYKLRMSIRQLVIDPMDFSVILIYTDAEGYEYIIVRYNGDHGVHVNRRTGELIFGPHIHKISEWCQMYTHKEEGQATPTDKYVNLQEAVHVFMKDLNISYARSKGVARMEDYE
ncbi:MAG: hypothetical protein LKJ94_04155 [Candidatus Methanomethylophilus sp.]|jgi:hypothetical protein|nr:hypothetical protein [Methanomethylophilus sp.]MCI2074881.1 hypothetical protein [Methanomethylophilus sp.]MCI2093569.1 hypothetical protein [Methanomethylophilus sp.]